MTHIYDLIWEYHRSSDGTSIRLEVVASFSGWEIFPVENFFHPVIDRTKEIYIPFWNFLVQQGEYAKEKYFLSVLAGELYSDKIATWKSRNGEQVACVRTGMMREGYFFASDLTPNNRLAVFPWDYRVQAFTFDIVPLSEDHYQ